MRAPDAETKGRRLALCGAVYAVLAIGVLICFGPHLSVVVREVIFFSGGAGASFAYACWKNRRIMR